MEQQVFPGHNIRAPSPPPADASSYDITGPGRPYKSPDRQYNTSQRRYNVQQRYYNVSGRQYNASDQQYSDPERQYNTSDQNYSGPERQYNDSDQQYYTGPERYHHSPERHYNETDQQYHGSERQYNGSDQRYTNGDIENFHPPLDEKPSPSTFLDHRKAQSRSKEQFFSGEEEASSSSPLHGMAYINEALPGLEIAHEESRATLTPSMMNASPSEPDKVLVVRALEDASSALIQQASALQDTISENEQLRSALRDYERELQNYKIDQELRQHGNLSQLLKPSTPDRSGAMQGYDPTPRNPWAGSSYYADSTSSLIVHPDAQSLSDDQYPYHSNGIKGLQYGSNIVINELLRSREHLNGGILPSSRWGEADGRIQPGSQRNMQNWKELVPSALNPLEEIKHLKKQLMDATSKEMRLVHGNRLLRTQIHELKLTIEQYQQDLAERPTYNELLEENAILKSEIRLTSQEMQLYTSSLISLLADYNLQPVTEDFHSIVSGIKALMHQLREEARKGSEPPRQPGWMNPHAYTPSQQGSSPSPVHGRPQTPRSPEPHGLDIVPQPYVQRPYSPSPPFSHNVSRDWEIDYAHGNFNRETENNNNPGYEPRNTPEEDLNQIHGGQAYERDPRLPTLPEETSDNDEDPLPDIEGLCINGEAALGQKITACGVSVNGTTLCHFQWVRHNPDGTVSHIPGAAQPDYTITADDIGTCLSLECTPMDDRNRKGEMVEVFVNDQNPITLDTEFTNKIGDYVNNGVAVFEVKLGVGSSQEGALEPALLTMKRSNYELKKLIGKRVIANEKYASESPVAIKVGKDSQCAICNNGGIMFMLDCLDNKARDLLVLTMREFIKVAVDRKRGKRGNFWAK